MYFIIKYRVLFNRGIHILLFAYPREYDSLNKANGLQFFLKVVCEEFGTDVI